MDADDGPTGTGSQGRDLGLIRVRRRLQRGGQFVPGHCGGQHRSRSGDRVIRAELISGGSAKSIPFSFDRVQGREGIDGPDARRAGIAGRAANKSHSLPCCQCRERRWPAMRPSPVLAAGLAHTFTGAPTSTSTAKLLPRVNDRLPAHDGGNSQGFCSVCANNSQPPQRDAAGFTHCPGVGVRCADAGKALVRRAGAGPAGRRPGSAWICGTPE